jgi:hypothetical protein
MNKNLKQMLEWMREDFRRAHVGQFDIDDNKVRFIIGYCEYTISFGCKDNWCSVQMWCDSPHSSGGSGLIGREFDRAMYGRILHEILDCALAEKYGDHLSKFAVLDENKVVGICTDRNEDKVREECSDRTLVEIRRADSLEQVKQRFPDWDWSDVTESLFDESR